MNTRKRSGYTLIELLIVLGLMAVLASLVVAFLPNAASSQIEARAAMQVQGWLNVAKQRAMRDQAPRGLRLILTSVSYGPTTVGNLVTDCQYLEQPDDFSGGTILSGLPVPPANMAPSPPYPVCTMQNTLLCSADLASGNVVQALPYNVGDPNLSNWSVQPGDYIEVLGSGLMHRIMQIGVVDKTGTVYPNYIVIQPPLPYQLNSPTSNYRIVRAPRAVGDQTLSMPGGTVIDLGTNAGTYFAFTSDPAPVGLYVDIMFSPSGAVLSPNSTTGNLNLWVRAPDDRDPASATGVYRGAPSIISIFTKTGFVGAYEAARLPSNPWSLVQ